MKWSALVVYLIACSLELKGSNGILAGPRAALTDSGDAAQPETLPIVTLLNTLCSSSTLKSLPAPALVSIANTLSATPQLFKSLPPSTLTELLSAVSSSPVALKALPPISILVLLAAVSAAAPSAITSIPPAVLFPLLKTLSGSGLLPPPGSSPDTVYTQLPPLPPPSAQVIVPEPAPGPMYINLPKASRRPPPIFMQSGPPPSIVISIPQPSSVPPLVAPGSAPGPIVISEDNTAGPPAPIIVPPPKPPNIYFTTHPSKSYECTSTNDRKCLHQPPFEMPRVYALPPGVLPTPQYFQMFKKST